MISTSLQKSTSIFLLTLDCAVAVCSTLEEPCLAYHGHKSQSFCIASAGHALRSTCCDFEELREDKARILSPWEYMAGLCSFRKHRKHLFNLLSCLLMWRFYGPPRQNLGFMFQDAIFTWVPKMWDSLESYTQWAHLCAAGLKKYSWNAACYTSHNALSIG